MQLINIQSQLDQYADKDIHLEVLHIIKSGKEATVYSVRNVDDGQAMALKVYKNHNLRAFKQNADYLAGIHIGSRTIRKAVQKKTQLGRDFIQTTWVNQEYRMLERLNEMGADVPEVYGQTENSVLLELIGTDGTVAPRLAEIRLSPNVAAQVFERILTNMEIMLQAGFIHGDLSAFNILYCQEKLFIIDFPQSVDIIKNQNSWAILMRDIDNISKHFSRYFDVDASEIKLRFEPYREMMAG